MAHQAQLLQQLPGKQSAGQSTGPSRSWISSSRIVRHVEEVFGHRTKYSIARLVAFQTYRTQTRPGRIFVVAFMSIVPTCSFVVLFNTLPLTSPTKGLGANYMFFIRNYLATIALMIGGRWQREYLLQHRVPWLTNFLVINFAAVLHTSLYWVGSKVLGQFPVHFAPLFVLPIPFTLTMMVIFIVLRRSRQARQGSNDTTLTMYKRLMLFECSLLFVFSAFTLGFRRLSGMAQIAYTLLLPLLKLILSTVSERLMASSQDVAAETEVFTVEFFSSLFMSMCLGGISSLGSSIALIVVDLLHMAVSITELKYSDLIELCLRLVNENCQELQQSGVRFQSSHGMNFRRMSHLPWFEATQQVVPLASPPNPMRPLDNPVAVIPEHQKVTRNIESPAKGWPKSHHVSSVEALVPRMTEPQLLNRNNLHPHSHGHSVTILEEETTASPMNETKTSANRSDRNAQFVQELLEFMFMMERMVLIE